MKLCEVCGPAAAPRPSGTETRTHNGITHKTRECALGFAANEQMKLSRDKKNYITESGRVSCDDCFMVGKAHAFEADSEPHPNGLDSYTRAMINLMKQQEGAAKLGPGGSEKGRKVHRPKKSQRAIEKVRARKRATQ
ncbi:hypothetical protein [Glycomyces sp. NPDC021274]|uniref:hypothetical protein n=1 Tax=Glycomyces sp. NPDC021274 TaxID=3155120 RepID=UPI0033CFEC43